MSDELYVNRWEWAVLDVFGGFSPMALQRALNEGWQRTNTTVTSDGKVIYILKRLKAETIHEDIKRLILSDES